MPLLDECAYIILPTNDVKTLDEMSFSALTAVSVAGVPADRLIVTAQTTRPGDDKKEFGYTGMSMPSAIRSRRSRLGPDG